jgi:hypothetical protein
VPAPDENAAWFVDPAKTVRYCVQYNRDIGVGKETFVWLVKDSLAHWKQYLTDHQSKAGLVNALTYEYQESCQEADLTFYGGTWAEEALGETLIVKQVICGHKAPAVAFRNEVYPSRMWSKGMIWITPHGRLNEYFQQVCKTNIDFAPVYPDWLTNKSINLKATLIHEIGHILGFTHVEGTIMSQNLSKYIIDPKKFEKELTHIDWHRTLGEGTNGQLVTELHDVDDPAKAQLFFQMTGHKPGGVIKSRLTIKNQKVTLDISDGERAIPVPLQFSSVQVEGINTFMFEFDAADFHVVERWMSTDGASTGERLEPERDTLIVKLKSKLSSRWTFQAGEKGIIYLVRNPANIQAPFYAYYEDQETFETLEIVKGRPFQTKAF